VNLVVVLGSMALIGALVALWWGLAARSSPARANLFAGHDEDVRPSVQTGALLRRAGERSRRVLPTWLVDRLERNLVQAGHPHGLDVPRMLGVKLVLATVAGVATALLLRQPVVAVVVATSVYFLPDYWVLTVRDQRQAAVQAKVPDTIDQLTICVEAGLGFDAALTRVAVTTEGPLTEELRRTISDVQAGVPRAQALRMLAERTQVEEVRQLVTALIQSQKHGVAMAETLRIQSAEIRLRRKQRTEEKAAKLAVKMLFPIVVCFLPVFMIVTVVPAFVDIAKTL